MKFQFSFLLFALFAVFAQCVLCGVDPDSCTNVSTIVSIESRSLENSIAGKDSWTAGSDESSYSMMHSDHIVELDRYTNDGAAEGVCCILMIFLGVGAACGIPIFIANLSKMQVQ